MCWIVHETLPIWLPIRCPLKIHFQFPYFGRFPFDQKFRKFRVWERMEQTFSGISFRNFGCTSWGWPKIPENRNNRKIPFHSTIPARAQFLRARKSSSTWLPILLLNISVPLVIMRQMTWMFFCTTFAPEPRQTFVSSAKMHGMAARPDSFPSGILPVGMTARVNSSQVSLVILKWPLNSSGK